MSHALLEAGAQAHATGRTPAFLNERQRATLLLLRQRAISSKRIRFYRNQRDFAFSLQADLLPHQLGSLHHQLGIIRCSGSFGSLQLSLSASQLGGGGIRRLHRIQQFLFQRFAAALQGCQFLLHICQFFGVLDNPRVKALVGRFGLRLIARERMFQFALLCEGGGETFRCSGDGLLRSAYPFVMRQGKGNFMQTLFYPRACAAPTTANDKVRVSGSSTTLVPGDLVNGTSVPSISRILSLLQQFDTRRLALAVAYVLVFAIALHTPSDPDTWWHLRSAEQTLANGIIREDSFSLTRAGERWLNHSWGGQLFLLGAWNFWGDTGLALLTSALATLGMVLVGQMMAQTGANAHLRAYILALGALTAAVFWSARPQMFSFVLSALTLLLLRRGGRAIWLLPPIFIIWANLHAGFVVGLLWLVLTALAAAYDAFTRRPLGARFRYGQWLVLFAACLLALCINPYGPELLLVPIRTFALSELHTSILEWQTPNLHQPATWPFLLLFALSSLALALSRRRPKSSEVLVVTVSAVMALWAGRHIALFAIASAPVLVAQLASLPMPAHWRLPIPPRMTIKRGLAHAGLLLALGIGAAGYAADRLSPARIDAIQKAHFPVAAVNYLRETLPSGPIFHAYEWGGYLLWELRQYPSFIDGRTLLFGDELLAAYRRAAGGAAWADLFTQYQIRLVLIPRGSGLERSLRHLPLDWELLYLDETAALYSRRAD